MFSKKLLGFLCLIPLIGSRICAEDIFIPLDQIMVKESKAKAFFKGKIGFFAGLTAWTKDDPQKFLFENLLKIDSTQDKNNTATWNGSPVPHVLYQHLSGQRAWEEILLDIKKKTEKIGLSQNDKKLFIKMVKVTFMPHRNAAVMALVQETVSLIKKLKKEGHRIFIVDNWGVEAAEELKKGLLAPLLTDKIIEDVIVSGQIKMVKGSAKFYNTLFDSKIAEKHQLKPKQTVIVENQPSYTKGIEEYNRSQKEKLRYVLYDEKRENFENLHKKVQEKIKQPKI